MKLRKMSAKVGAFALAGVLALGMLVGCSSSSSTNEAANNAAPAATNAEGVSQAAEGDMLISVSMKQDVTSPEAQDSPNQFAEETIDIQAPEGATALTVLEGTGREVKTSGTGDNVEVTAIGGLANGDAGDASHWTWTVNGEEQKASPAVVTMSNGDAMVWTFVAE